VHFHGCSTGSVSYVICVVLQVVFERNRGGQSVDMICRELMLDEEKAQTPKRPRTKKKKGGSKTCNAVSQPEEPSQSADAPVSSSAAGTVGNKTTNSCLVSETSVS